MSAHSAKSLMFGFVTHTANPIGGRFCDTAYGLEATDLRHCIHGCCYCYARGIKEDHPEWEKYSGPYRLFEKELKEYPDGAVVFLQDMGDIGDPTIPTDITDKIFIYIADHPKVTYLLLTKNPEFYDHRRDIAGDLTNIIWGVTAETNNYIPSKISRAPSPFERLLVMSRFKRSMKDPRILISIEPIMDFNLDSFVELITRLNPELVAVGYDNHPQLHPEVKLPEPALSKTMKLIETLEEKGIKVYRKTLREPRI